MGVLLWSSKMKRKTVLKEHYEERDFEGDRCVLTAYCIERPIEVLRFFALTHAIVRYEDLWHPFGEEQGIGGCGIIIDNPENYELPEGVVITKNLGNLVKKTNLNRSKLEKELTIDELKKRFGKSLEVNLRLGLREKYQNWLDIPFRERNEIGVPWAYGPTDPEQKLMQMKKIARVIFNSEPHGDYLKTFLDLYREMGVVK